MSATTLTPNCCHPDVKSDLHRHVADYHPSIWRDYFLQYASESMELDKNIEAQIETLKNEVRKMLVSMTENPLTKVDLIDSICRLGVSYHFEQEVDEVLQHIHKNYVENGEIGALEDNLRSLAVLFRLLRQHGLYISPYVFNKFKDVNGNFSERLTTDVEGMLSLYEASHLMVHGEDILEEALSFTSTHLESIATQLSPTHAAQVKHCLRQPLHKNLPRLEARSYMSIYEQDPSHNEILLTFAKLDFNMLQSLHQKEFGNICKWWKELDVPKKLPFVRDRFVECCFWSLGTYFEPQYSQARKIMMKVIGMISIIDDTYDSYGTIGELELFTKAIERLMDDIVSNEFEQKRGHVCSFLECYTKQYGKSMEDAIHECRKRTANAWKDINEEFLRPTEVPMAFLTRALNLSRFMDVIYKDKDNYTHAEGVMKTYIKALFVDPVPI
ncbi:Terpenoid cyclases/protein prenyltransferase alpha-alpha toroid [Sesbania bispinosa]|nr:Terpenoid cyclases/protein prenyltransferase alpha-alpha toroid [Sesbania bispinosa]